VAHSSTLSYTASVALYTTGAALLLLIRTPTTPERQPGSRLVLIREGCATSGGRG
jgi:hypothetical protein